MSRMLKIIFTLSLVINVLLMGIVGGFFYKRWQHMPSHDPAMREALDPETRHLMARHFRDHREDMKERIKAMHGVKDELMSIMAAEKFDRAAYDQVVEKLIAAQGERMALHARTIGEIAGDLPAVERQKLVGSLFTMGERRPRRSKPRDEQK